MKEFKGTKGSWYHNFNGQYWEVRRKEDFEDSKNLSVSVFVFDTKTEQVKMIIKEAEANARLMASAPEMLTMLIEIVEARRIGNEIPIMEIESVINKAIGE